MQGPYYSNDDDNDDDYDEDDEDDDDEGYSFFDGKRNSLFQESDTNDPDGRADRTDFDSFYGYDE
jgi:hypothetical protein